MTVRIALVIVTATLLTTVTGQASAATWSWREPLLGLGTNGITGVACPTMSD